MVTLYQIVQILLWWEVWLLLIFHLNFFLLSSASILVTVCQHLVRYIGGQIWDLPTHWFPCFKTQEITAKHLKGLCHAICYLFYKLKSVLVLNSHSNSHWICIKFQHFNFVIYIYIIYNKILYILCRHWNITVSCCLLLYNITCSIKRNLTSSRRWGQTFMTLRQN